MAKNFNFDKRQYPPVGKCIYCGVHGPGVKLSREHIIPYSLGGRTVLPKASCTVCAEITRDFEQTCARTIFGAFRIHQKMPTRHGDQRPDQLPLRIMIEGREERRMVPVKDYPGAPLMAMELGPPGIIVGLEPSAVFASIKPIIFAPTFPDTEDRLKQVRAEAGPGQGMAIEGQFNMPAFSRLLAKIAHAYAVAEYGLDGFQPFLVELILGRDDKLAYYIGGTNDALPDPVVDGKRFMHLQELGIYTMDERHLLCARLRLFSTVGFPVYWIVIGNPTPDLTRRLLKRVPPKTP